MASRRREPRFPSCFAVTLEGGEGVARNVSASGIYFETRVRLQPGALVRFTVDYEPQAGGALKMHCQGRVVRIEELDERFGIGACIEELGLRRTSEGRDEKG